MARGVFVDDEKWREFSKSVADLGNQKVRIGVFASQGGDEQVDDSGFTVLEQAIVHELGSSDGVIPERSFIRRTFYEKQKELAEMIAKVVKAILAKKITREQGLKLLGEWGAAEVKKTVMSGPHIPPPLQKATIARKGSDRPLVDTGRMINSVTYEIGDE